jgi:hypothetical protein
MAYVGFDLDETLGRFSVPSYASFFLQPKSGVYESIFSGIYGSNRVPEAIPLSAGLKARLDNAFDLFVNCLVEKEDAQPALGLIRPSMIPFIRRLYELKQVGAVKAVIIYSNNGNPALLHLAAKMLEKLANAPGLFCDYIHWFHPLRANEITFGRPGMASKSIQTLLKALNTSTCNPTGEQISVDKVYFFDDSTPPHYNISQFLGDRYFHLKPYNYDADPNVILECFKNVMEASGLTTDQEYYEYVAPILGGSDSSYAKVLQMVQSDLISLKRKMIIPNDTQLKQRFNQTFPKRTLKSNFTKALATLRKYEKKQNEGISLTDQDQANYNQAKTIVTNFESENPNLSGGKRHKKTKKQRRKTKN